MGHKKLEEARYSCEQSNMTTGEYSSYAQRKHSKGSLKRQGQYSLE